MAPEAGPGSGTDGFAPGGPGAVDRSIRVTVPSGVADIAGAVLMDLLGPFELEDGTPVPPFVPGPPSADGTPGGGGEPATVTLVFYPSAGSDEGEHVDEAGIVAALPAGLAATGEVRVEVRDVSRVWADGWKEHFRPIVIGEVRIRPPWEAPAGSESGVADVVINPGLGFGTGLHPTTRGTLELLQEPAAGGAGSGLVLGPLVDVGTGSGILAIAAAKLGWGPVFAFDNDPVALVSARENVEANGVAGVVEVHQTDVEGASPYWFSGATVLANMTLDPVLALIRRLARQRDTWNEITPVRPVERLVVSGVLAGGQEEQVRGMARLGGFRVGRTKYEGGWATLELLPAKPAISADPVWG